MTTAAKGYLATTIDGTPVAEGLADGLFDLDFERGVSQATVTAVTTMADWAHDLPLTVAMGAGDNNVDRFSGIIWDPNWKGPYGRQGLFGRGKLSRLETFKQTNPRGQTVEDLTGVLNPTIGQLVMGLLDAVGLAYDPAHISDDPSILLATLDPTPLKWQHNWTARQYADELQKVSVGRRFLETVDGDIFFAQVIGRPRGDSDFIFTQGVDIFGDWSTARTIRKAKNYASVFGYTKHQGTGGQIIYQDAVPNAAQPVGDFPVELRSEWVQTAEHAYALWDYLGQEFSREWVEADFVTYKDVLLGPGQTISVLLPDGQVTEPMWLRGVAGYMRGGKFRQHLRLQGGGEAPVDYAPEWL